MLSLDDYLGPHADSPDVTPERRANALNRLLPAVHTLIFRMQDAGVRFRANPATGTLVSGTTFGGFRPQSCRIGAAYSNHKQGLAVDLYDPDGAIDAWCLANLNELEACGIWLESPDATLHWSHWQCVPPRSGRRVFNP